MWVEIIVAKGNYLLGAVINIPESIAQGLVDSGLAKPSDGKPKTKAKKKDKVIETKKVEPTEEG